MKKHSIKAIEKNPNIIFSEFEEINLNTIQIFCISEGTLGNIFFNELSLYVNNIEKIDLMIGCSEQEIAECIDETIDTKCIKDGLFIIAKNLNPNCDFLSKSFIEESTTFYENNFSKNNNINLCLASNELLKCFKDLVISSGS